MKKITTERSQYRILEIEKMCKEGRIKSFDDNSPIGENTRWNRGKASLFIESLIVNIPTPPIILWEENYMSSRVVDGAERLSAIIRFFRNEYCLEESISDEIRQVYYQDLPNLFLDSLLRRRMTIVTLLDCDKDFSKIVYNRLN
jgi:hypothetical protein